MDWRPLDPGEEQLQWRGCPLVTPFICLAAWSVLGWICRSWTKHLWGLELGKGSNVTSSHSNKHIYGLVAVLWSIVSFYPCNLVRQVLQLYPFYRGRN